jgi:hypothetical protein
LFERNDYINGDLNNKERFYYNMAGRVCQYINYNVNDDYSGLDCSLDSNFWDWHYRYSPLGGREQKRLYYSPHSDGWEGYTHPWTYYLRGAYGEQLVTRVDGTKELSVTDHLGSVRAVVNDQDTTVLSYSFKPFGDTLSTSAGDVARIGFIGQEQDIEHGSLAHLVIWIRYIYFGN